MLGVILYREVVLRNQISTFTIAEIFLRMSNPQHIGTKLQHSTLDGHTVKT